MVDIYDVSVAVRDGYKKFGKRTINTVNSINNILNFIDGQPRKKQPFIKRHKKKIVGGGIAVTTLAAVGVVAAAVIKKKMGSGEDIDDASEDVSEEISCVESGVSSESVSAGTSQAKIDEVQVKNEPTSLVQDDSNTINEWKLEDEKTNSESMSKTTSQAATEAASEDVFEDEERLNKMIGKALEKYN